MGRIWGVVGAMAMAVTIFLGVGEVLARATGILDRLNGYTHLLYVAGPDPDLPYLLRPGTTTALRGMPIRVNARGLRGGEVAPEPAPGVHRVLVVGDSVVFGQEMTEDQTVAQCLQRRLDTLGAGPAEVLNGGVPGYDSVSELRFLESQGLALHPETVVVGVSLNDHDVTPQLTPFGVLIRKDLDDRVPDLVDHSEFLTLLRWGVRWARGDLLMQLVARENETHEGPPGAQPAFVRQPGVVKLIRDLRLAFYRDPAPRYWDRMREALAGFGRVTAAHGVRLLIAIFPEEYQVGVAEPDLTPQRRLLDACREAGLPCLDLQPAFARAGGDLFVDVSHPNAAGHAVAGDAIAAALMAAMPPAARDTAAGAVVVALEANGDGRPRLVR